MQWLQLQLHITLNIEPEKIKNAVNDFQGVKRRFEYIIAPCAVFSWKKREGLARDTDHDVIFIDDYAHHPQELNALIAGRKVYSATGNAPLFFSRICFQEQKTLQKNLLKALTRLMKY